MEKAIIVKNVTKKYKLYNNTKDRLIDLFSRKNYGEEFYALSNVNFEANAGEVIGFIGINGSGKSTLSNIIAGIVPQTKGTVVTNGEVSLIAVAAGLKNDLTGRDNIELKLLMLGFNKHEIKALEKDIIEFSELDKFIDQPVKSYSSGMKSRLGFAISVNVDPDILIIDEALSVGDKAFAEKSLEKMREFKENGKTMIFVSHSISQMKKFCDKILWLEFGRVKEYGDTEDVIPRYEAFVETWRKLSKSERKKYEKNALKNKMTENEQILQKTSEKRKYFERPVSRLGKFRTDLANIYESPNDSTQYRSSKSIEKRVYYIKNSANVDGEIFYLISTKPSAVDGIVGWVKKTDLLSHAHIPLEEDVKRFRLTGEGKGYNEPWGDEINIVLDDLAMYKGYEFTVNKTHRVGKSLWYYGKVDGINMWIHFKQCKEDVSEEK